MGYLQENRPRLSNSGSAEVRTKRPKSTGEKNLRVNLINCKYDIVSSVCESLNFKEVETEDELWDLYWTDLSVSAERVSKMNPFQAINHFPGMMDICRKASLVRNLKRMYAHFPDEYNFFPQSWFLPQEVEEWRIAMRRRQQSGSKPVTYIVKPDAGAMGRGIYLVQVRSPCLELYKLSVSP
ncbi:hypothetical protein CYMTET_27051 [Cymbomonas tetramitiformis]|uniref:Uncharacterized protein n=1 Tax=Cymbomonas tetramitiformis TaxID=36881 RepID=A0AAE0KXD4_9CHLO|nr:hypothetical protein CYMTET_27051 [Cymbomonas tetramitiformis]